MPYLLKGLKGVLITTVHTSNTFIDRSFSRTEASKESLTHRTSVQAVLESMLTMLTGAKETHRELNDLAKKLAKL